MKMTSTYISNGQKGKSVGLVRLIVFRRGVPLMIGAGVTAALFNEINKVEGSPECR